MKKRIIILFVLILSIMLSGCGISDIVNNIPTNLTSGNINLKYGLEVNEVENYTEINDSDVATVVSNIVMPATVEITCTINYTYTYTSMGWGGFSNRTISDSQSCQATGFFINSDGYLMTNAHVVTLENESNYRNLEYTGIDLKINYADSSVYFDCEVVSYDTNLDLCIFKLKNKDQIENIKYVTFFNMTNPTSTKYNTEDAVKLYYGETCVAIGNANGYGISVTKGVVSAPYRNFTSSGVITPAIQTDAAINSGNSGGPLVNKYACVIGINSFKTVTTTSESLGFAIPSYEVMEYIEEVSSNKNIKIDYYYTNERAYVNNLK